MLTAPEYTKTTLIINRTHEIDITVGDITNCTEIPTQALCHNVCIERTVAHTIHTLVLSKHPTELGRKQHTHTDHGNGDTTTQTMIYSITEHVHMRVALPPGTGHHYIHSHGRSFMLSSWACFMQCKKADMIV